MMLILIAVALVAPVMTPTVLGQYFEDPSLNVSFDPPEGWVLKSLTYGDTGRVEYSGPVTRGAVIPSIEVSKLGYGVGFAGAAGLLSGMTDVAGGSILREESAVINGVKTLTLVHRYGLAGHPGVAEVDHMIVISGQDSTYMITYADDARHYDSRLPVFEKFLKSLRIEGAAIFDGSRAVDSPVPMTDARLCGTGTMLDRSSGQCAPVPTLKRDEGGCLIATAAYGTELAPEVQNLREIRNKMYETEIGGEAMRAINHFYYSFSPAVADWERENDAFREMVRLLITPAMLSFAMVNHEEISSEGLVPYVVGIVILNVGMYFVAPVAIVFFIKRATRLLPNGRKV
ncbi:MAG: hypothetical protein D9C04_03505 [Nitrosopumilus sp. B06]|nr:MAG: hypothetical protein D9C04_03505 [Nitrosopumilus sp. B06]